jgi:hypothetical protein
MAISNTELSLNDESLKAVRSWILSDKQAGQERGLRITPEDVRRLQLKHPGQTVALHLKHYIQAFFLRDLKVRVYNFPKFVEVWTSYEPRISKARKS